ncbi:nuclear transport factor 2 family protein [Elizabethkingia meningoseptica]|uniref:nuclear transport factor 2 family protein n=1 Tax=Elizabethkingia meningoseptica TaxID=238 RepID=UPI00201225B3|nr:nuclear transport factor 2 family protein [Elizabethkingia meningoseptica]MCL1676921.1 nuclear transport factor 2 family protein [Elizabethkingia meningoseptica]MCL1685064.1 nuclear transport factor 2 family protein [Elizabethkingia meningoseptica]
MLSLVSFFHNSSAIFPVLTEQRVLEYEHMLYRAMKESDVETLDRLLHCDLLFIIPDGTVITKAQDLKNYKDKVMQIEELIPEVESLNIIEDTAVTTITMQLKGKFMGNAFEAKFRYIRFWKNIENELKVIGGSGTLLTT